ncbi:hypothetical protein WH52_05030 [Tenacibaculum holothuriorum]|uniref:Uncharacterized protein n=2 Tax=Tenacibaculum holothuriorum TaxID=1635173 RepID=A0A1Y2PF13_9FLAO|nr:hypothetical protein WH52_05030 [Tenacibaculum holothuriorum]
MLPTTNKLTKINNKFLPIVHLSSLKKSLNIKAGTNIIKNAPKEVIIPTTKVYSKSMLPKLDRENGLKTYK